MYLYAIYTSALNRLNKFTSPEKNNTKNEFANSFGAWKSEESAEEIIGKIKETNNIIPS